MALFKKAADIKVGVVGYGGAFGMGKWHLTEMQRAGSSKSSGRPVQAGNIRWSISGAGRNSPQLTGTPTSSFFSMRSVEAPPSAAWRAATEPAGPAPTTTTSKSVREVPPLQKRGTVRRPNGECKRELNHSRAGSTEHLAHPLRIRLKWLPHIFPYSTWAFTSCSCHWALKSRQVSRSQKGSPVRL